MLLPPPGSGLYGLLGVSGGLELASLLVLLLLAVGLLAGYWLWARRDRRTQLSQQRRETSERNNGGNTGFRQTELKPMMTITSNGSGNMTLPAQGNLSVIVTSKASIEIIVSLIIMEAIIMEAIIMEPVHGTLFHLALTMP